MSVFEAQHEGIEQTVAPLYDPILDKFMNNKLFEIELEAQETGANPAVIACRYLAGKAGELNREIAGIEEQLRSKVIEVYGADDRVTSDFIDTDSHQMQDVLKKMMLCSDYKLLTRSIRETRDVHEGARLFRKEKIATEKGLHVMPADDVFLEPHPSLEFQIPEIIDVSSTELEHEDVEVEPWEDDVLRDEFGNEIVLSHDRRTDVQIWGDPDVEGFEEPNWGHQIEPMWAVDKQEFQEARVRMTKGEAIDAMPEDLVMSVFYSHESLIMGRLAQNLTNFRRQFVHGWGTLEGNESRAGAILKRPFAYFLGPLIGRVLINTTHADIHLGLEAADYEEQRAIDAYRQDGTLPDSTLKIAKGRRIQRTFNAGRFGSRPEFPVGL